MQKFFVCMESHDSDGHRRAERSALYQPELPGTDWVGALVDVAYAVGIGTEDLARVLQYALEIRPTGYESDSEYKWTAEIGKIEEELYDLLQKYNEKRGE